MSSVQIFLILSATSEVCISLPQYWTYTSVTGSAFLAAVFLVVLAAVVLAVVLVVVFLAAAVFRVVVFLAAVFLAGSSDFTAVVFSSSDFTSAIFSSIGFAAAGFTSAVFSAAFVSTEVFASSVFGVSALTAFFGCGYYRFCRSLAYWSRFYSCLGCSFLCSSHVYSLLTRDLLIFSRILGYHFLWKNARLDPQIFQFFTHIPFEMLL